MRPGWAGAGWGIRPHGMIAAILFGKNGGHYGNHLQTQLRRANKEEWRSGVHPSKAIRERRIVSYPCNTPRSDSGFKMLMLSLLAEIMQGTRRIKEGAERRDSAPQNIHNGETSIFLILLAHDFVPKDICKEIVKSELEDKSNEGRSLGNSTPQGMYVRRCDHLHIYSYAPHSECVSKTKKIELGVRDCGASRILQAEEMTAIMGTIHRPTCGSRKWRSGELTSTPPGEHTMSNGTQ